MEITVSVKQNSVPTVVPCYWETFENNRNERYANAETNPTIGFRFFCNSVLARLQQGRRKFGW